MKRYFLAEIKEGIFKSDKSIFRQAMKDLPDGKYLHCLLKISDRNNEEWRAYYFATINGWSLSTGIDKKEVHEQIKKELFPILFKKKRSTTQLTNEEWNILLWNVEEFLLDKYTNRI